MFQSLDYPKTRRALEVFGLKFTQYLKGEISNRQYPYGNPNVRGVSDKIASGKLINSIKFDVEVDGEGNPMLVMMYVDYFDNVNLGRKKGKTKVPIKALLDWIKIRGIEANRPNGIPIPPLSLAFAIQTNIYKFGIRPTNIYDKGLDGLLDFVENPPPNLTDELQEIYDMIAEDVNMFIEKTITKIQ